MAKRLHFCTALLLSLSVFATGCTVDIQDPNEQEDGTTQPGDPSTTNTAPVIELMGEPVITIPVNSSFLDPGVRATDAEDGDITSAVYSNSMQVNTSQSGRYEITYRVADSAKVESVPVKRLVIVSDPVSESTVPLISSIEWIMVGETGDYLPLADVKEGGELGLSSVTGNLVNIIAQSEDEAATGSIHFLLTGPIEIDRVENSPPYALANENAHLNVIEGELPAGDYTLVATPYAESNGAGDVGLPHIVNFTIKAAEPTKEPEIIVVANNDSYTYQAGSDMQPGQVKSVSENDEYGVGAVFSITQGPTRGSVSMFDLGFFTYTPQSGFSGTDFFTYQIAQAGKTSSATVSIKVEAPVTETNSGFTIIKPSADSRLIYVSSSLGSDANTCLSEAAPCKTIKAGLAKMRHKYPDHLYLKRGDVWRDEKLINLNSGRSASEPAVISYYGVSGLRPKIEGTSTILHVYKGAEMKDVSFIGLEFSAYRLDPNHQPASERGIGSANLVLLGSNENILFEDNKFNYSKITLQEWEGGVPKNITLRRNIFNGAYYNQSSTSRSNRPSNLYADGVVGLYMEENVFDHGGWNSEIEGAGANMFNHNIYIQYTTDGSKLTLKNNIITRGASHGAQLRSGGVAENNFFARNTVGLLIGLDAKEGALAHAIGNVISEGGTMVKGDKACSGASLCTRAVWGLHMEANDVATYQATDNIVTSRMPNDDDWPRVFPTLNVEAFSGLSDARIKSSNNIEWNWASQSSNAGGYLQPGRTLGDYNESLGGSNSFEGFMGWVLNRPVGHWDERYTAGSINKFIREGFSTK